MQGEWIRAEADDPEVTGIFPVRRIPPSTQNGPEGARAVLEAHASRELHCRVLQVVCAVSENLI
eukprot:2710238-Amphidinium_carterae.1